MQVLISRICPFHVSDLQINIYSIILQILTFQSDINLDFPIFHNLQHYSCCKYQRSTITKARKIIKKDKPEMWLPICPLYYSKEKLLLNKSRIYPVSGKAAARNQYIISATLQCLLSMKQFYFRHPLVSCVQLPPLRVWHWLRIFHYPAFSLPNQ